MRSPPQTTTPRLGHSKNATHETTIYYSVDQADTSYPPNATSPIQRARPVGVARIFKSWWLEILAAVLVVVSFSGLVAVLHRYQGKPLPNWPLNLSLNTALSLFGAVFRAPVLFIAAEGIGQLKWQWLSRKRPLSDLSSYDSATRGPWGATKLLWKARWRDGLAFLGAAIIVVSFGIDPFTQAVVGYYDCSVPVHNNISSVSHLNSLFGIRLGNAPKTQVRVAIDQSFSDPTSIMPNYTCSTPRCEFANTYHSIGLCSKCIDVADQLVTSCVDGTRFGAGCNYTLTHPGYDHYSDTNASYVIKNTPGKRASKTPLPQYGVGWKAFTVRKFDAFQGWDKIQSPFGLNGSAPDWQSSVFDVVSAKPVLASRCFIYYCMRSYTAKIEAGILNETLVSTSNNWSVRTRDNPVVGTVNIRCLSIETQKQLLSNGQINEDTEWMPWTGMNTDLGIPAQCVYQLQTLDSNINWDSSEAFSDRFQGSLNATTIQGEVVLADSDSTLLAGLWDGGNVTLDTISTAFSNFATATTNYLRTINNPIPANVSDLMPDNVRDPDKPLNPVAAAPEERNKVVEGQAFADKTCIRVRWPWLALPAAIFLGTLIFLLGLIAKTAWDHETEVWKSSPLALLWHGLAGEVEEESVVLSSKQQMDDRAKDIQVILGPTRRGRKLVQEQ